MTTDYGLRTTDHGLRTTDHGPRTTDCGLWTVDCGLWTTDCALRPPPPAPRHPSPVPRPTSAFSLVEILVTVTLLSFIILGLFAVFNQTQRAFMTGMAQTDVLEASRAATDMLGRELEELTPSGASAVNYYVSTPAAVPLTQPLPGSALGVPMVRTNFLQDVFILTRQNQTWTGIGYCVRVSDAQGGLWPAQDASGQAFVGSLYRYSASLPVIYNSGNPSDPMNGLPQNPQPLYSNFVYWANQPGAAVISNRVCDGIVNFRLRAFAPNGFPIYSPGAGTNAVFRTNSVNIGYSLINQAYARPSMTAADGCDVFYTWGSTVPASLELELGMLEPRTFSRYNSIPDPIARRTYFQREETSSRVQVFRQRIPIRNVDPSAFQ